MLLRGLKNVKKKKRQFGEEKKEKNYGRENKTTGKNAGFGKGKHTKTSCTACDSGCCRTDCQFALQHCRQNLYRTYSGNRCGSAYWCWLVCTNFNVDKRVDATLPYAVEYARIYIFGSIFVLIVLGMNLFITTQGFSKISMMTTLIGAVINVILDPIFIFVFDMGVRGAAIATVLSQAVGAIWVLRFLTGEKTILKLKLSNMKLNPKVFGPCLALGISSFVMISTG